MARFVAPSAVAILAALSMTACSRPYHRAQQPVGGGLPGPAAGAAVNGPIGGRRDAVNGGLIGGAAGAPGGGAVTPQPLPPPAGYQGRTYRPPPPPFRPY